ncbi:MAG: hypothetical protein ABEN55_21640 [Bradymonadaceae bacterium]
MTRVVTVVAVLFVLSACNGSGPEPDADTGNENADEEYGSPCEDHTDCSNPPADWCGTEKNICVECRDDTECGEEGAYFCESDPDSHVYGKCVECDTDEDCDWKLDCEDPKQPTCVPADWKACDCREPRR